MITIIVAMDEKRGIGKNNTIPWHNPEDLKHFKKLTLGQVCIMGRKTWESLPVKPLPDRKNVVITTKHIPDVESDDSLEAAIISCQKCYHPLDIYLIGGQSIYEEGLQYAEEIIVTNIQGDYQCDRFFPALDDWKVYKRDGNIEYYRRLQK